MGGQLHDHIVDTFESVAVSDVTNLRQLTQANYDYCPLVPDHKGLFQSTTSASFEDGYQVFDMPEDGSGVTQLTHDVVFDGFCR